VRGHLDADWSEWFARMTIARERDGTMTLTGALADQAALYGVLVRVRNLGLPLISVNVVDQSAEENRKMISRIWHGWTTLSNADKYETLLTEEIFVGIQNRHIRGFKGIQLLRRHVGDEVEFVTIMLFDSLDAVREFAGQDYEQAVVPEKARAILARFDERSQHYQIRVERKGDE
jgi:heme-degrading monooxygenase HmoA